MRRSSCATHKTRAIGMTHPWRPRPGAAPAIASYSSSSNPSDRWRKRLRVPGTGRCNRDRTSWLASLRRCSRARTIPPACEQRLHAEDQNFHGEFFVVGGFTPQLVLGGVTQARILVLRILRAAARWPVSAEERSQQPHQLNRLCWIEAGAIERFEGGLGD